MTTEQPSDNLVVRVSSDPSLMKHVFSRLKEPQYQISENYEEQIKKLRGIKSTEKGVLVSKVTSPADYQTQLKLLSHVQNMLDHIHNIVTDLYIIQSRYKELLNVATRIILLNYFDELNVLKDGMRKAVMGVALEPIQQGIDRLETLIDVGESVHKHLTATNFNIKEATSIIENFMSVYKYGSSVRVPPDAEV